MQPCRCLQECNTGGCLHHDNHRLWLGRCTVCCPRSKILCQSQYGLPEAATGLWKTWCWSGKWTTNKRAAKHNPKPDCGLLLVILLPEWFVWLLGFLLREQLGQACSPGEVRIELKVSGNAGWYKRWSTTSEHLLSSCALNPVIASCVLRRNTRLTPLEG